MQVFRYSFAVIGGGREGWDLDPTFDTWATACRGAARDEGITVVNGSFCWHKLDFPDAKRWNALCSIKNRCLIAELLDKALRLDVFLWLPDE